MIFRNKVDQDYNSFVFMDQDSRGQDLNIESDTYTTLPW